MAEDSKSGYMPCFHCGKKAVIWGTDFTAEEYGYDFEGIVHHCHCTNCGADVLYIINFEDQDGDSDG